METTKPVESKVFAQVLTTDGYIHVELAACLISWSRRGAFPSAMVGVSPVDHARNESVRVFLKHKEYTHMLFLDDDTVPPVDAIRKLMALNADIATGITPILRKGENGNMETCPNAFISVEEGEKGSIMNTVEANTGIQEIVRCGASCLLIRREVLEAMEVPWFHIKWRPDFTGYIGEDIYFCDKAKEMGYKIMCDTSVVCHHSKAIML